MPEGDTILRGARVLHAALAGRVVTRFESALPALTRVHEDAPLTGRTVDAVESRGKWTVMRFSGGLALLTHLRMSGSWHLYRPGERWRGPASQARIVVGTDAFVAVGFRVPVAELVEQGRLEERLGRLGPDVLDGAFDAAEAVGRLRARPALAVGDALLRQDVVAGVGNVFRSEACFACGIHPATPVGALADDVLAGLVETTRRQMRAQAGEGRDALAWRGGRRTTGRLDPAARLWVYGRAGRPCLRCGTPVERGRSGEGRVVFWCPACQPAR